MKNRTIYLVAFLFTGIIAFYSCKKDEKNNVRDLLVNKVWLYDTLTISDLNDEGLLLVAAFMHLGFAGGEFDFKNDGTYTIDADIGTENGTWELKDNNTLIMDGEDEMEILTISDTHLELKSILEGVIFTTPYSGYVILKFNAL